MPSSVTVTATDTFLFGDAVMAGKPGSLQIPPKYPLALAATQDLLNWSNAFPSQTTPSLSSGIGVTDQSLTVASGTGVQFPTELFEVSLEDEIIFVTSRSGDVLSGLIRGVEGTTPASHLAAVTVQLLITALSHNQVVAEIVALEQTLGPRGSHLFPTEVSLAPGAGGNFTVAHGLGVVPKAVLIQMTSGGAIWFQSPRFDATNLYLTASDGGITGVAAVWS